jgi:hypothetical protein
MLMWQLRVRRGHRDWALEDGSFQNICFQSLPSFALCFIKDAAGIASS